MEKRHEYQTSVTWSNAQGGRAESPGLPTLTTAPPLEFGGAGGNWSPEHLFLSSAHTCVLWTFVAMARISQLEIADWRSNGTGTVERLEGQGWMFTGIVIEVDLTVVKASDTGRAERLLHKAEQNCLISKSMNTPVKLETRVSSTQGGGE